MKPEVTQILNQLGEDGRPTEELFSILYNELRQLAFSKIAHEREGHTLQATALVNEAFIRLVGRDDNWDNRRHFYAAASEAMRRILIESARRKQTEKRGSGITDTEFNDSQHVLPANDDQLLEVHSVVDELELEHPERAQIVKLRFFVGLTIPEIAELMEIGERTVSRHWDHAKVWLVRAIRESE